MAGEDFYRILGVSPAASADEIKSAYRELVKKYHPDLFSMSGEKSRANEKLQRINDAYAVIGDSARRREYDEKRSRRATSSRTRAASPIRRPSPTRTPVSPLRWSRNAAKNIPNQWKRAVSAKWLVSILALITAAVVGYAAWEKPKTAIAWTLLAETVVERSHDMPRAKPAGPIWTAAGSYGSRSQCADALKDMVKKDEQEGSKAIFDERQASIAITVQLRDETALAQEYFDAKLKRAPRQSGDIAPADNDELLKQATEEAKEFIRKNGLTKRVKSYECRMTRVLEPESWLRRKLREVKILS
jgi:hypothetical protein